MADEQRRKALWAVVLLCAAKKKWKRERTLWSKQMYLNREIRGSYYQTCMELYQGNNETHYDFFAYTRMPRWTFDDILAKITPIISKKDTIMRDAIPPAARLEATLRFLITGIPYTQLQYYCRISNQSLSKIIPQVCEAIVTVLKDDYLKVGLI